MEHLLPALKQDYNYLVEKYQPKEYVPFLPCAVIWHDY